MRTWVIPPAAPTRTSFEAGEMPWSEGCTRGEGAESSDCMLKRLWPVGLSSAEGTAHYHSHLDTTFHKVMPNAGRIGSAADDHDRCNPTAEIILGNAYLHAGIRSLNHGSRQSGVLPLGPDIRDRRPGEEPTTDTGGGEGGGGDTRE